MLSHGENLLRKILTALLPNEKMVYNVRPDWLNNPHTGHNLELDVFIPRINVAFEFHGEQHISNLSQMKRDSTKQLLCKNRGIVLYEITTKQLSYYYICQHLQRLTVHYRKTKRKDISFKVTYCSKQRRDIDNQIKSYKRKIAKIPGHKSHEILYDSKNWIFSLKTTFTELNKKDLDTNFQSLLSFCKEKNTNIFVKQNVYRLLGIENHELRYLLEVIVANNLGEHCDNNCFRLAPVLFDRGELYSWNRKIWA